MRYYEIFSPINTQNLKGSKMIESDLHTHIAMGVYNLCVAVADSIETLTDDEVESVEHYVYSLQVASKRAFASITALLSADSISKSGCAIEVQSAIEDLKLFVQMQTPEILKTAKIDLANNDLLVRLAELK